MGNIYMREDYKEEYESLQIKYDNLIKNIIYY
jgi:hypothetical protein